MAKLERAQLSQRPVTDTIGLYLDDLAEHPILSHEEARLCLKEIAKARLQLSEPEAERAARQIIENNTEKLVVGNLKLVVKIAKKHRGKGIPFSDLIQEGNFGLYDAVDKFDFEGHSEITFDTFATYHIQNRIFQAIAEQKPHISINPTANNHLNHIKSVKAELTTKLGEEPSNAEIYANLRGHHRDISLKRVCLLQEYDRKFTSIETPITENGEVRLKDIIANPKDDDAVVNQTIITVLGEQFISRMREIFSHPNFAKKWEALDLRFGSDLETDEAIGDILGVSQQRAKQLQNIAMARIIKEASLNHQFLELITEIYPEAETTFPILAEAVNSPDFNPTEGYWSPKAHLKKLKVNL